MDCVCLVVLVAIVVVTIVVVLLNQLKQVDCSGVVVVLLAIVVVFDIGTADIVLDIYNTYNNNKHNKKIPPSQ